jgi:hypothetical protein
MRMDDATWRELTTAIAAMPEAIAWAPDDFTIRQLTLSGNLFIQSLNAAAEDLNARTFRDVDFSFRDVLTSVQATGIEDAFAPITATIQDVIERLRSVAGLPPDVIAAANDLKRKLAERKSVVERSIYLPPDVPHEPPPHDPATLAPAADSLRRELNAAGFETPVMDDLATSPGTFEVRDCAFLIDEIDGILA